jgi:hypothetical protein
MAVVLEGPFPVAIVAGLPLSVRIDFSALVQIKRFARIHNENATCTPNIKQIHSHNWNKDSKRLIFTLKQELKHEST